MGSDKLPKIEVKGNYNNKEMDWTKAYPNSPVKIWESDGFQIPDKSVGNRLVGTAWCEVNEAGDKVRAISCAQKNREDYVCPISALQKQMLTKIERAQNHGLITVVVKDVQQMLKRPVNLMVDIFSRIT